MTHFYVLLPLSYDHKCSLSKPSICDTGAQLTVLPYNMLADMKIKPETIFPVQTSMQGASEVPIMVEGGVLVKIAATDTQTQVTRQSLLIYPGM